MVSGIVEAVGCAFLAFGLLGVAACSSAAGGAAGGADASDGASIGADASTMDGRGDGSGVGDAAVCQMCDRGSGLSARTCRQSTSTGWDCQ